MLPTAIRELGPRWLLYRAARAVQLKSGLARVRNRARSWSSEYARYLPPEVERALASWKDSHSFYTCGISDELRSAAARFGGASAEADSLLAGNWRYFGVTVIPVGFPPDWSRNPLNGRIMARDRHWSEIREDDSGDVKLVWEANRFQAVYALVRAYAVKGDEKYPAAFWKLIEDWQEHNPPQLGPNWKCGQEAAFRLMAWYFGLHAFADSPHTTAERLRRITAMIAVHASRIERNIGYALSQNNNHGLSEAVALWTVGLLSPELCDAARWRDTGRRLLERLAREQIYADGSYVQHSTNYHRLMLHDLVWALRLGELNACKLSDELYAAVARAVDFLAAMVDPTTGRAPNYGHNDGSCILALNNCEYQDFRPVLQAANYAVRRRHMYAAGPWDEDLLWLFGPKALRLEEPATVAGTDCRPQSTHNGYFVFRGPESRALVRCCQYVDRPAQADQLHFDFWWRGLNIACDPGTFQYNGLPPWENALAATSVHNTVVIDGRDQMLRAGKFLWLRWAQGSAHRSLSGLADGDHWQGEHNGYSSLGITHRRAIMRHDDTWIVVDDICGRDRHRAGLHWLLSDFPHQFRAETGDLSLQTSAGCITLMVRCSAPSAARLIRGGECIAGIPEPAADQCRGWYSPTYAYKVPALSLVMEADAQLPLRFVSVFQPAGAGAVTASNSEVRCADPVGTSFNFSAVGDSPILPQ